MSAAVVDVPGGFGGWVVRRATGTVGDLHALDVLGGAPPDRTVWVMDPVADAVVLGSAQRALATDTTVVRRSGGGAVLVDPACSVWLDVVVPRGDPLWDDDVTVAGLWLGQAWQQALAGLGVAGRVHRGGADRHPAARAACFAGVGPGEVVAADGKLVGVSQRRTRHGARFQCIAYVADPPVAPVVDAIGADAPAGLADALAVGTAVVPVGGAVLVAAATRAIMAAGAPGTGPGHDGEVQAIR